MLKNLIHLCNGLSNNLTYKALAIPIECDFLDNTMIGSISGVLARKAPNQILVEAGGVGYELEISMHTFTVLPAVGERVSLSTHLQVREDAHLLYGFWHEAERMAYRQLVKTNGVGPRTALAILSTFSVPQLIHAVQSADAKLLTRVPGIGAKTADRLLLELKDKLTSLPLANSDTAPSGLFAPSPAAQSALAEVRGALISLGYKESEVTTLLKTIPEPRSVEEGIRQALKALAKT